MTAATTTPDAIFEVLANGRRRQVLAYLQESGEASVQELAEEIVRGGTADSVRRDGADDPDVVAATLHHVHLPKLSDANLLAYESDAGRVVYVGGSAIASLLADARERFEGE